MSLCSHGLHELNIFLNNALRPINNKLKSSALVSDQISSNKQKKNHEIAWKNIVNNTCKSKLKWPATGRSALNCW